MFIPIFPGDLAFARFGRTAIQAEILMDTYSIRRKERTSACAYYYKFSWTTKKKFNVF